MKIDFPRINKKLKKRIRVLKRKLSERRGNLKRVKGYVPVVTKKVDCSDMFKQPKNANISVTYCYNRETLGDMFFDIRMTNSTAEIKPKKFGTVSISVNGGKVGLKRMMKFLTKNHEKFVKIRKGTIKMTKRRKK